MRLLTTVKTLFYYLNGIKCIHCFFVSICNLVTKMTPKMLIEFFRDNVLSIDLYHQGHTIALVKQT